MKDHPTITRLVVTVSGESYVDVFGAPRGSGLSDQAYHHQRSASQGVFTALGMSRRFIPDHQIKFVDYTWGNTTAESDD